MLFNIEQNNMSCDKKSAIQDICSYVGQKTFACITPQLESAVRKCGEQKVE